MPRNVIINHISYALCLILIFNAIFLEADWVLMWILSMLKIIDLEYIDRLEVGALPLE